MKRPLSVFAANNALISVLIFSVLAYTGTISLSGLLLAIGHLATTVGLLTYKRYGWYLNVSLSVNVVVLATFSLTRSLISSDGGGSTSMSGHFLSFGLLLATVVSLYSILRTNRSDILQRFAVTKTLKYSGFAVGIAISLLLMSKIAF